MDKGDSDNMAPNIDEIKIPDVSEFNEDDEDLDFETLQSDMDSINNVLDQIEERADTILAAIQALTKSMKEERSVETLEKNIENTTLDDAKDNDKQNS